MSFSWDRAWRTDSSMTCGSGSLPRPTAPQASRPLAGSMISQPVAPQQVQVVLRHRIFVHACVHGRRGQLGAVAGQYRGGQHIVRQTVGQLGKHICRGRSDDTRSA